MKSRLILSLLIATSVADVANAQEIELVERLPFEPFLTGLVDFDELNAAPFPGNPYDARLPFRGLIAHTYFAGQIPTLANNQFGTYARNVGLPAGRLTEAQRRSRFSRLMIISTADRPQDAFLAARLLQPSVASHDRQVGYGTTVLKFSDRQFVLGFDLRPMGRSLFEAPIVGLRFFGIDGQQIGPLLTVTSFGLHTFATKSRANEIVGVEFTNLGPVPFGIDDVVFEQPLVIGML